METAFDTLKQVLKTAFTEKLELEGALRANELEQKELMKQFFLSIIKIIDNFENKEENLLERHGQDAAVQKVIQSYRSIKKQLLSLLEKHEVTPLTFPDNCLIPGYAKVVDTEPDRSKPNDTIISIVKNGYAKGDVLIREAEVIVVKN